ncbi:MAG: hypothetical protein ACC662_00700 [Planctomycetota bacterium]
MFPFSVPFPAPLGRGLRLGALVTLTALFVLGPLLSDPAWATERRSEPLQPVRQRLLAVLTETQRHDFEFLEHLGWRIEETGGSSAIEVLGGSPSTRATPAEARAAGDLRIRVPRSISRGALVAFAGRLEALADSLPSRSAYQLRLAPAVERATKKLAANTDRGRYEFPHLFFIRSPTFKMLPPEPEWIWGKWKSVAKAAPSKAIAAFYDRRATAECYAAQWVALYAIQLEVFGPDAFDASFRPEEFVLGRPGNMRDTPIGRFVEARHSRGWRALLVRPKDWAKDTGLTLARLGRMAFVGASGVVENVDPELRSNDNFVIVSVSPRANEVLRTNGGFAYVRKLTEKAWKLHKAGQRGVTPGSSGAEAVKTVDAVLSDPVLEEILVYVHPLGIVPLREIVQDRIGTIERPVKVRIYQNGVADFFYRRYRWSFHRPGPRPGSSATEAPPSRPPPVVEPRTWPPCRGE